MFKLKTGRMCLQKSVSAKKQQRSVYAKKQRSFYKRKQKREDDVEEDKISGLPDEVMLSILSLLPMEEAARISVLARQWRKVWTFIPILNFDASQALLASKKRRRRFGMERDEYVDWVNLVLEAYQGSSIEEFRVRFDLDQSHGCDIDKWIYFAMEKKVKRLVMEFPEHSVGVHNENSWLVMEFQKYSVAVHNKKAYSFPPLCDTFKRLHSCRSLITLELNCVNISGGVAEYFIASCPLLRQLSVEGSDSLVDLKVSGESLCLEYLKIANCFNLECIYISAANLSSFAYFGQVIKIAFADVPNLVELSFRGRYSEYIIRNFPQLSNFASQLVTLKLDVLQLERKVAPQEFKFPLLAHLKNFELRAYGSEYDDLLNFAPLIEAAPSMCRFALEFIWIENVGLKGRRPKEDAPKCLHHCLKEVELAGFVGHAVEMELAMYLIENAIALEKIIIDPLIPSWIGCQWSEKKLKEIPIIKERVMKLKSEFSLGDKLVLRNF